ncbi:ubiquitin carboxyl-terminal hydrolase [Anaeramoeba flamelloides]|uniref:Ubiquitin carboxyl-terminal hydrolase n=1 Tax=Anaeramoeba flamelloides TaxID=1746091 RepID=A0ABQ8YZ46_9EUKA|nr:ubiquitin carboxyl-terminal hydrolase [Anaeramoeba flamelloides]
MPRIKKNNYALPNKKTGMHYQKQGSFSVPRPRQRQRQRSRFDTDIEDGVEVKVGNLPFPKIKSTELPPTSLYQNLLNVLEQSESGFKTIDISTMRKDIMKLQYFMRFQNYNQQDALEFLENIFNQLQFELFKYYKKTKNNIINLNNNNNDNGNQDNNSNKKKNKKNKNKKKTKTGNKDKDVVFSFKDFQNSCPISKNFDFLVSVNFICEGCGSKSQKVEIFRTLSLKFNKTTYENFESNSNDVLKNKTKTQITPLNELLDSFFQDNEIITKKCSDCGANFAKRFLKIIKLPRFLLLHIQRVGIKKDKKPKEKKNKNSNKNCVLNNNNEIDVNSDGGEVEEEEEEEEHFSFFKIPNLVLFPDKLNLNEYCLPNYTKNCHTPLPNILSRKQTKKKLNSNFQDDNNNHKTEGDEELSKVLELSKKEFEESDLQKALKMSLIEHKKRQELSNIDENGKGNQLEKEPFKININQDIFSQKLNEELNSKYVLCSVVIHTSYKNTAKFGHYFTYISENGKKWKSFNDSIVKDITKNHVFENKSTQKNCYLLCYINKSCIKK